MVVGGLRNAPRLAPPVHTRWHCSCHPFDIVDRLRFRRRSLAVVAGLVLALGVAAAPAAPAPDRTVALTPDYVLASLNGALAWYQRARVAMQSVDGSAGVTDLRDDRQTTLAILRSAFDLARAQAAALAVEPSAAAGDPGDEHEGGDLDAVVKRDAEDVARLAAQARRAPAARWAEIARQLAAASNRLELDQTRADLAARLKELDDTPAAPADLAHQIQALQDGVPELRGTSAPAATPPPLRAEPVVGTWPLVHQLIALSRMRATLAALGDATAERTRAVAGDVALVQTELHMVFTRLREVAKNPGAGGDLAAGQREFHDGLERSKRLAAAVVPARQEAALLSRYATDLTEWRRTVDGQVEQVLRGLAVELLHVAIAVGVILVGALLWRVAVNRYVGDAYRRHLLLTVRNVVVGVAVALVVAFHFTSELATLVTALGVAAAGIAFALQTIIVALAVYFAIVAPNGIRVGDRVSLQGPYGWVQGDVVDIGFLRIKLRELTADPPQPTGRIVVFPNSVVFTGSFVKHPVPN